jgi:beta-xylosidase
MIPESPLFRCPVFDGAADPTVIHKRGTEEWWMFYTARRATLTAGGCEWITGTRIGVAVSSDGGSKWEYRGVVEGLDPEDSPGLNTHWAPEVVWHEGKYHMFLTWGAGAPGTWTEQTERRLVHFTSDDLETWEFIERIDVGSENVIDAAVAVVADGQPRLWFKDEVDGATTWSAVSSDATGLTGWRSEGQVIGRPAHEGPNVFRLGGWYWMVVDEWRGQAVHRSADGLTWERQEANNGLILDAPGSSADDATYGRHADVVTQGDHAYIFYFTHPEWQDTEMVNGLLNPAQALREQRTSIHAARLNVEEGVLVCTRNLDSPLNLDPALI